MSRISKALTFGFIIGMAGLIISFAPFMHKLEESIGLDLLFKIRGQRPPPPDVVIVSIDKESSEALNLPNRPEKWPHSLHARLIEYLFKEGAAVIAFDIFFTESYSYDDDVKFVDAIRRTQNVVLVERIKKEELPLNDRLKSSGRNIEVEKLVPPVSPLAEASAATAPFPLPKVSARVNQYWTFKTSAGDIPTLPVMAFQIFTAVVYDDFIGLLKSFNPLAAYNLPQNRDELINTGSVNNVTKIFRGIFEREPQLAEKMVYELQNSKTPSTDERRKHLLESVIRMYMSPSAHYLNFYGFPRTITTIPYYEVLQLQEGPDASRNKTDFKGKAVFVGSSEKYQPEQRDGFYTVFTDSNGLDISGVEIAATAFANLLEAKPIQPLPFHIKAILVLLWGLAIGVIFRLFHSVIASIIAAAAVMLYSIIALHQFTSAGIWYPVVVPLFLQTPLVLVCSIIYKYVETSRERHDIRKAFSYYLPDEIVDRITKNISNIKDTCQVVYGTCLYTDAERYTSFSETMSPEELSSFMNKYYEAVFAPVKQYGGIVSNVIGDAMLAIWVTEKPDAASRKNACLAALDIKNVAHNRQSHTNLLPTRIALHSGHISLGNIGAGSHYEYRPVGDIVNTATRMDGLNKYLGTRILLSEEVLNRLDGIVTREVGKFLLAGKSQPLVVHELLCKADECTERLKVLCAAFSDALDSFKRQQWQEALEMFDKVIKSFGDDGPSLFYMNLCKQYIEDPQKALGNGIVQIDKK